MKHLNSLKRLNYLHFLKVAIGSTIAVLIAKYVNLEYATSAGIITLLTIQTTKKETLQVSIKRVISFIIAMCLSSFLFLQFGFYTVIYGVFLLFFIILCHQFGLEVGITSNAVLITHILGQGEVNSKIILNEVYILLIGASIGVIINLFIPKKIKTYKEKQKSIDGKMKEVLLHFADEIITHVPEEEEEILNQLIHEIEQAIAIAKQVLYNSFDSDTDYYLKYMEMRKNQSLLLKDIHSHIHRIGEIPSQAYEIASFIRHISDSYHEYNNATRLLDEVSILRNNFKKQALPVTRQEFESRAVLFQIFHDFEYFLRIKYNFANSLSERQKKFYWKESDELLQ